MNYAQQPPIRDELIAFCHMVKAQNSAQAGRAAASFLSQVFGSGFVAIYRTNSAGNALILWEALLEGDSHFQAKSTTIAISPDKQGEISPLSYAILTGQDVSISAPFAGYDLSFAGDPIFQTKWAQLNIRRLLDRRGKLVGVVAMFKANDAGKNAPQAGLSHLLIEVIGRLLGDAADLNAAEKELADMSQYFEKETQARQYLQARIISETSHVIGESPPILRLRREINRVAKSKSPVMLVGEDGVGRRAAAREIHNHSDRANGPFRVLDMKRLSDASLHPELLGYKRGAIDGVASARRGVLVDATNGTLLLKNFESASPNAQELIWQVLETAQIRSLGSEMDRNVDIRFITSVGADFYANWSDQNILPGLFHKLAVNVLHVPALNEIQDDLRLIIHTEIERLNRAHHRDVVIAEDAVLYLSNRSYKGNLTELRSFLERLHHNAGDDETVNAQDVQAVLNPNLTSTHKEVEDGLRDQLKSYERILISNALQAANGSRAIAAEKLKLPKRTLAEKCKNLGL